MPALMKSRDVSDWLKCTERHVSNLDSAGKMPEPIRIGRSKRWIASDIILWIELRCPNREKFEAAKLARDNA